MCFRAIRLRKVLGGGLRQAGVVAAPAAISMKEAEATLTKDHRHAKLIAQGTQKHTQLRAHNLQKVPKYIYI